MNRKTKNILWKAAEWVCRIVLVAVFLMAAVPKLLDPALFAKDILNYRVSFPIIGQNYIYPVAMFMPALELVAALALLFPRWKRIGSLLSGGLLFVFTILIFQAVARGLNIDCGCFGRSGVAMALAQQVGWTKILENVLWMGMAALVFWRSQPRRVEEHALWEGD